MSFGPVRPRIRDKKLPSLRAQASTRNMGEFLNFIEAFLQERKRLAFELIRRKSDERFVIAPIKSEFSCDSSGITREVLAQRLIAQQSAECSREISFAQRVSPVWPIPPQVW